MEKLSRGFASDNFAGVHPKIMEALASANVDHSNAYGEDPYTKRAKKKFTEHFGENIEVFFVYCGTGANIVALKTITNSFHSIITAETAHINMDECGAPEKFTGCKLIAIASPNGKITVDDIRKHIYFGEQHRSQPKVISITQATEFETVYAPEEISRIANFAHENGMLLHMDGARLANAAVSLDLPFRAITRDVGVDVLSFGGTKNSMMFGEAIVFFDQALAKNCQYYRKQASQLHSKMRFISAQFEALLTDNLWYKNAYHANQMAQRLYSKIQEIPEIKLTQTREANSVFAIIPKKAIDILQEQYEFYIWNPETNEVRWMCSFDTTEKDIDGFVEAIREAVKVE